MDRGFDNALPGPGQPVLARLGLGLAPAAGAPAGQRAAERVSCFHCGEPCLDDAFRESEKTFCCQGCLIVHDLLAENGLEQFYTLSRHPGVRIRRAAKAEKWAFLDEAALQQQLLDFTDGASSRVTLHLPAIHCVACVWLLENLFRLHPGVGQTQVNFPRREVSIAFSPGRLKLSELVELLASIGYEPRLTLGELERRRASHFPRRQWLQLGIAGFAFGNVMLFSLPVYLGLDSLSGPLFRALFGYLSLALALPVLIYSASDYWRSALLSFRQRVLTLDVPIAFGLAALFGLSGYNIVSGRGAGYLDSFAGLVFFLLCGRLFQQKTQERIAFDRDYRSFFPLSITRRNAAGEEIVALSNLRVGDRLVLRNGELIPADARLVNGQAFIDYSFVTGEAEPVAKQPGDYLYAGGQQVGGAIEVETLKAVSQSYLTSLWSHDAFRKQRVNPLNTLTNRYSRWFTRLVVVAAIGAGVFWVVRGDAARGFKAFTSVLIVACPCALALAAPFTLGTAQRLLARVRVFLKDALILERLAQIDAIVFDKTGTLTSPQANAVNFRAARGPNGSLDLNGAAHPPLPDSAGAGNPLSAVESSWIRSLARHSTHPHSVKIADSLAGTGASPSLSPAHPASPPVCAVEDFSEIPGCGLSGRVQGHELRLGSSAWLEAAGVAVPEAKGSSGSVSYLAIDGACRGAFVLSSTLRPEIPGLLEELSQCYELTLLSGDNERDQARFRGLFGRAGQLRFNHAPLDKLAFIHTRQASGKTVMMVGDGLNDAGALRQSDVGVAVVEAVGAFSPASDVILEGSRVPELARILALARKSVRVVYWSFGISALYNLAGVSIAAAGVLSPIVCAILMPLSSFSVVLFACGATSLAARRAGLTPRALHASRLRAST